MPMNNMLEYSQNYAYSSGSDYEFVRDKYDATDDTASSRTILIDIELLQVVLRLHEN